MIVLARLLTRLIGVMVLALIALVGLAAAIFCIQGGHGSVSLAGLAGDAHLAGLRADVGAFLAQVTAPGPVAIIAAVAGAGAVALGLVLLAGAWVPTRPRVVALDHTADGTLSAAHRPLARLLADRAGAPVEISAARARARARRRHDGGRVRVTVRAAMPADRRGARTAAREAVGGLGDVTALRVRVRARRPSRRDRKRADGAAHEHPGERAPTRAEAQA